MLRTGATILGLLAVISTSLAAQKQLPGTQPDSPRQGFFFSVGLGAGSVGIDCAVCSDDRESGVSGGLRLGASISPHVMLAFGTAAWFKREDFLGQTLTSTVGWATVVLRVYPSRTGGFWLEIGAGLMVGSVDDEIDEVTSAGPGGTFALGYDFTVGSVALTPYLLSAASQGNLKVNGFTVLDENFNPNLVQFGLALTVP